MIDADSTLAAARAGGGASGAARGVADAAATTSARPFRGRRVGVTLRSEAVEIYKRMLVKPLLD